MLMKFVVVLKAFEPFKNAIFNYAFNKFFFNMTWQQHFLCIMYRFLKKKMYSLK